MLVGDGIGGGPDEHAVTAHPNKAPAAAQSPACLPSRLGPPDPAGLCCRTYGSLSGDRLYYRDGRQPNPVRAEKTRLV